MLSEQTVSFIFPGDIMSVTPSESFWTPATAMGAAYVWGVERHATQTRIIPRNDFMGNELIDELVFMVWKNCGAIAVIRVILR
jgi:hypothetical protein